MAGWIREVMSRELEKENKGKKDLLICQLIHGMLTLCFQKKLTKLFMIIIDTSYIIAFFSEKDFHHKKAVEFISQLDEDLFAPIEVIQELMTTLSRKVSSLYAVKVASSILENNSINIINSHELVFDKAFDTFKKLNPHKFSFC